MYKFKLYDKKHDEMLGPFSWDDIEAVIVRESLQPVARAVIRKDNRMILIRDIGPRYAVRPKGETGEEYREVMRYV